MVLTGETQQEVHGVLFQHAGEMIPGEHPNVSWNIRSASTQLIWSMSYKYITKMYMLKAAVIWSMSSVQPRGEELNSAILVRSWIDALTLWAKRDKMPKHAVAKETRFGLSWAITMPRITLWMVIHKPYTAGKAISPSFHFNGFS